MSRRVIALIWIVIALMLAIVPLPAGVDALRPDWVTLAVIYWTLMAPQRFGLVLAWLSGLLLDTLSGALLGQHGLALAVVAYISLSFHLRIRVFPIWQMTMTVFALLTLYQFGLYWIDGVAGRTVPIAEYWGPVLSGTVLWPALILLGNWLQNRFQLQAYEF